MPEARIPRCARLARGDHAFMLVWRIAVGVGVTSSAQSSHTLNFVGVRMIEAGVAPRAVVAFLTAAQSAGYAVGIVWG